MIALLVSALAATPFQNLQHACGQLTDTAAPSITFSETSTDAPVLERRHQLLELFSRGDGELHVTDDGSGSALYPGAALYPLPWEIAADRRDNVRLVAWQDRERVNDENMLAIVLGDGESWCSPELEWERGARLRYEAMSLERDRPATLELTDAGLPFPGSFTARRQTDIELDGVSGKVCFRVSGGTAAIGEPRIVEPRASPDGRPRWIVLTIVDSLRGDVVRGETAPRVMPTLHRLGERGHLYERVVSPGCHTRASVWPILMGRDLMRVDPIRRRQSMPVESPLSTVYSRANLFVSHLAESAGYHAVFLGNNAYLRVTPAFSRYSRWGDPDTGIVDVMSAVPDLMKRYADEKLLLVYYVSAPHGHYRTPKRLFDRLECRKLEGLAQCRCAYDARVLHADEAIRVLRDGLHAHRLDGDTVQIVTADHGELFEDGWQIEGEMPTFATGERKGAFQSFNRGHGLSCHPIETDVPLVVHGKNLEPRRWTDAVSGLDIMPTMLALMDIEPVNRLDGVLLPLSGGQPRGDEPLVSYGFCSDSVFHGDTQLLWWVQRCRLRNIDDGSPVDDEALLWSASGGRSLDASPREAMRRHESWIEERLGADTLMFELVNVTRSTLVIEVVDAVITDYGPAYTRSGFDAIASAELSSDRRRLTLELDGYRGLYHVSTDPPNAPATIRLVREADAVHFVGPMQLPFPTDTFDPKSRPDFFFTDSIPERRKTREPAVRLWWHRFGSPVPGEPTQSDR